MGLETARQDGLININFAFQISLNQMKKFFLCLLIVLPTELFAQEDLTQGVFKQIIKEDIQDGSEGKLFDPKLIGQFVGDLDFNNDYQATDRQKEYKEGYARSRLFSKFSFNKNFAINSLIRLDQTNTQSEKDRRANTINTRNQYFQNQILYIQELTATYENKDVSLLAGKFTPNFGTAWKWGRGIWSYDLARNYKETEKLGVGGIYRVGDIKKTGLYNFGFSTFTNDRNNLDNSLISNRDSDAKSNAKPGDTKSLKSYVASMDVLFEFSEKEKLSYHFSYMDLAINSRASSIPQTKIDDQKAYAAGMNYRYPVSQNFLIDSLLEYVDMKNVNGNSDVTEKYSTASFVGELYKNWNITLATTNLVRKQVSQNGYDQNLSEISAGYKFDKTVFFDQFLIQVGYKNFRTNYKNSLETNNSYGVLLRYIKSF